MERRKIYQFNKPRPNFLHQNIQKETQVKIWTYVTTLNGRQTNFLLLSQGGRRECKLEIIVNLQLTSALALSPHNFHLREQYKRLLVYT